jgi:hypothetical protein
MLVIVDNGRAELVEGQMTYNTDQYISPPRIHESDCAVHNEPAAPNGPCDCTLSKPKVEDPPFLVSTYGNAMFDLGAATADMEEGMCGSKYQELQTHANTQANLLRQALAPDNGPFGVGQYHCQCLACSPAEYAGEARA